MPVGVGVIVGKGVGVGIGVKVGSVVSSTKGVGVTSSLLSLVLRLTKKAMPPPNTRIPRATKTRMPAFGFDLGSETGKPISGVFDSWGVV